MGRGDRERGAPQSSPSKARESGAGCPPGGWMEAVGASLRGVQGPARSSPTALPGAVRDSCGHRRVSPQGAAAVPSPEGAALGKGLSRGAPPQEPQDAGRQRWEVCRIPHFGGKQERKHPIKPQNPRGVLVAPAPPRTETPNLPGTTESRGCRHLLTCRPRVCCYPAPALPLFLSSFLLLLSPSPCCLGLFMEIHSFMPSHRSLSVSLPPGGRACDASPLSSHFPLSQSGAAPTPGGRRAGTRVGSPGRGSVPQRGVGMTGRGHGTDPLWGTRALSCAHHCGVGAPAGLSALPNPRRAAVRRRGGGVGEGGLHPRVALVFSASPFSLQPVRHRTLHPRYICTRRTPIQSEH